MAIPTGDFITSFPTGSLSGFLQGSLVRTQLMANLEAAAVIAVAGFALIMTGVSAYSYMRLRRVRAFYIAAAFFVFTVKGAWLVVRFLDAPGQEDWILPVAALDLLILFLMFLAVKRSTRAS